MGSGLIVVIVTFSPLDFEAVCSASNVKPSRLWETLFVGLITAGLFLAPFAFPGAMKFLVWLGLAVFLFASNRWQGENCPNNFVAHLVATVHGWCRGPIARRLLLVMMVVLAIMGTHFW